MSCDGPPDHYSRENDDNHSGHDDRDRNVITALDGLCRDGLDVPLASGVDQLLVLGNVSRTRFGNIELDDLVGGLLESSAGP